MNTIPRNLFWAGHGKRASDDNIQRYMVQRPNSMIFLHKAKRGGAIFLPRPNSLINAIKGKRFRSPNSFNYPLLTRLNLDTLMEPEEEMDIPELLLNGENYGKRKDDAFDLFLGNRG